MRIVPPPRFQRRNNDFVRAPATSMNRHRLFSCRSGIRSTRTGSFSESYTEYADGPEDSTRTGIMCTRSEGTISVTDTRAGYSVTDRSATIVTREESQTETRTECSIAERSGTTMTRTDGGASDYSRDENTLRSVTSRSITRRSSRMGSSFDSYSGRRTNRSFTDRSMTRRSTWLGSSFDSYSYKKTRRSVADRSRRRRIGKGYSGSAKTMTTDCSMTSSAANATCEYDTEQNSDSKLTDSGKIVNASEMSDYDQYFIMDSDEEKDFEKFVKKFDRRFDKKRGFLKLWGCDQLEDSDNVSLDTTTRSGDEWSSVLEEANSFVIEKRKPRDSPLFMQLCFCVDDASIDGSYGGLREGEILIADNPSSSISESSFENDQSISKHIGRGTLSFISALVCCPAPYKLFGDDDDDARLVEPQHIEEVTKDVSRKRIPEDKDDAHDSNVSSLSRRSKTMAGNRLVLGDDVDVETVKEVPVTDKGKAFLIVLKNQRKKREALKKAKSKEAKQKKAKQERSKKTDSEESDQRKGEEEQYNQGNPRESKQRNRAQDNTRETRIAVLDNKQTLASNAPTLLIDEKVDKYLEDIKLTKRQGSSREASFDGIVRKNSRELEKYVQETEGGVKFIFCMRSKDDGDTDKLKTLREHPDPFVDDVSNTFFSNVDYGELIKRDLSQRRRDENYFDEASMRNSQAFKETGPLPKPSATFKQQASFSQQLKKRPRAKAQKSSNKASGAESSAERQKQPVKDEEPKKKSTDSEEKRTSNDTKSKGSTLVSACDDARQIEPSGASKKKPTSDLEKTSQRPSKQDTRSKKPVSQKRASQNQQASNGNPPTETEAEQSTTVTEEDPSKTTTKTTISTSGRPPLSNSFRTTYRNATCAPPKPRAHALLAAYNGIRKRGDSDGRAARKEVSETRQENSLSRDSASSSRPPLPKTSPISLRTPYGFVVPFGRSDSKTDDMSTRSMSMSSHLSRSAHMAQQAAQMAAQHASKIAQQAPTNMAEQAAHIAEQASQIAQQAPNNILVAGIRMALPHLDSTMSEDDTIGSAGSLTEENLRFPQRSLLDCASGSLDKEEDADEQNKPDAQGRDCESDIVSCARTLNTEQEECSADPNTRIEANAKATTGVSTSAVKGNEVEEPGSLHRDDSLLCYSEIERWEKLDTIDELAPTGSFSCCTSPSVHKEIVSSPQKEEPNTSQDKDEKEPTVSIRRFDDEQTINSTESMSIVHKQQEERQQEDDDKTINSMASIPIFHKQQQRQEGDDETDKKMETNQEKTAPLKRQETEDDHVADICPTGSELSNMSDFHSVQMTISTTSSHSSDFHSARFLDMDEDAMEERIQLYLDSSSSSAGSDDEFFDANSVCTSKTM